MRCPCDSVDGGFGRSSLHESFRLAQPTAQNRGVLVADHFGLFYWMHLTFEVGAPLSLMTTILHKFFDDLLCCCEMKLQGSSHNVSKLHTCSRPESPCFVVNGALPMHAHRGSTVPRVTFKWLERPSRIHAWCCGCLIRPEFRCILGPLSRELLLSTHKSSSARKERSI